MSSFLSTNSFSPHISSLHVSWYIWQIDTNHNSNWHLVNNGGYTRLIIAPATLNSRSSIFHNGGKSFLVLIEFQSLAFVGILFQEMYCSSLSFLLFSSCPIKCTPSHKSCMNECLLFLDKARKDRLAFNWRHTCDFEGVSLEKNEI